MKTFALALLALGLAACSDSTAACDPASTPACGCPGGAQGRQTCAPFGAAPACVCPTVDAGGDVVASDGATDVLAADVVLDRVAVDAPAEAAVDVPACDADTRSDPMNCGRCGNVCPLPPHLQRVFCTRGECDFTGACVVGYANCDQDYSNGCETPTLDDPRHCGGCGTVMDQVCTAPTPMCIAGRCSACPAGQRSCRGGSVCTDLISDNNNCGDCARVCGSGTHCVGALCVPL